MNATKQLPLLMILLVTVICIACDGERDPASPTLTLTGTWDAIFSSSSGSDSALFVITEEDGFIRGSIVFPRATHVIYGTTTDEGEIQLGYSIAENDSTSIRYVLTASVLGNWDEMAGVNVGFVVSSWTQQYYARFTAMKR
jgi:hypothetical protein